VPLPSDNPKSLGDFVTLTGTGTVRRNKSVVTGGGTFKNQHANGVESNRLSHGVVYVTGFNSFENRGGKLPSNVIDSIGKSNRQTIPAAAMTRR